MKTLKDYITESFQGKKYPFKIKVAGGLSEDLEKTLKTLLEKFGVDSFTKQGSTPIQGLPLDFPKLRNVEVNIFDVTLNYPTTPFELHEYLCGGAQLHADNLVVRNPNEPTEQYQQETEERTGALLDDPSYKELPKIKTDDYYGTKYNQNMLKELAKDSKARAKERGEKIPGEKTKQHPEYDTPASKGPISGSK